MKAYPMRDSLRLLFVAGHDRAKRFDAALGQRFRLDARQAVDTPGGLLEALRLIRWDIVVCQSDLPHLRLAIVGALLRDLDVQAPIIVVRSDEDATGDRHMSPGVGVPLGDSWDGLESTVRLDQLPDAVDRAWANVRLQRELCRRLLDYLPDIAYAHDSQGVFTYVNHAIEGTSGYCRDEVLGRNFAEFVAPDDLELARRGRVGDVPPEMPSRSEFAIIAKDGRRVHLEVTSWLILRDGAARGIYGFARSQASLPQWPGPRTDGLAAALRINDEDYGDILGIVRRLQDLPRALAPDIGGRGDQHVTREELWRLGRLAARFALGSL